MTVSDQIMSPDGDLGHKISLHAHRKINLFIYSLISFGNLPQASVKKTLVLTFVQFSCKSMLELKKDKTIIADCEYSAHV